MRRGAAFLVVLGLLSCRSGSGNGDVTERQASASSQLSAVLDDSAGLSRLGGLVATAPGGTTRIRGGVVVTGDIFCNGALVVGVAARIAGNVRTVGSVVLSAGAQVTGSVVSGSTVSVGIGAAVGGGIMPRATVPLAVAPSVDAFARRRGLDFAPGPGGVLSTPPTLSGAFTFNAVSVPTAADFSVSNSLLARVRGNVSIGTGARVTVRPGQVLQLLIDGDLTLGVGSVVDNKSAEPDALLLVVRGRVSAAAGAQMKGGVIYAPGSTMVIAGGTGGIFQGAVVGASVELGTGTTSRCFPRRPSCLLSVSGSGITSCRRSNIGRLLASSSHSPQPSQVQDSWVRTGGPWRERRSSPLHQRTGLQTISETKYFAFRRHWLHFQPRPVMARF